MDFKVGDTVIIKNKDEILNEMNIRKSGYVYSFVYNMNKYCNTKRIIRYISEYYCMFENIKDGEHYKWHHTWIEKKDDFFSDEDFLI